MLFTDNMLKNTCSISMMTKEDFEYFNKFVNEGSEELWSLLYKPSCITLFFDKGIMIFEIFDDMQKKERICFVHACAKKKEGKQSEKWDEWLKEFYNFLRLNKCKNVIQFQTNKTGRKIGTKKI